MDGEFLLQFPSFALAFQGSVSRQTGEPALDEHLKLVALPPKAGGDPHIFLYTDEAGADEMLETVFANRGFRKFRIANPEELRSLLEYAAKTHQYVAIDANPKACRSMSLPIANLLEDIPSDQHDRTDR
jgi:hypothetical protein